MTKSNRWETHEAYLDGYLAAQGRLLYDESETLEEVLADQAEGHAEDGVVFTPVLVEAFREGWVQGKEMQAASEEVSQRLEAAGRAEIDLAPLFVRSEAMMELIEALKIGIQQRKQHCRDRF